jgi:hypothetical protein
MSLVKDYGICDFCGDANQQTDFKCWWCRRYICDACKSERVIIHNEHYGHYKHVCKSCNEEKKKCDEKVKDMEEKYYKDVRELEEKFLNSRLELNPKYKGTNTKWRDIAWSE